MVSYVNAVQFYCFGGQYDIRKFDIFIANGNSLFIGLEPYQAYDKLVRSLCKMFENEASINLLANEAKGPFSLQAKRVE